MFSCGSPVRDCWAEQKRNRIVSVWSRGFQLRLLELQKKQNPQYSQPDGLTAIITNSANNNNIIIVCISLQYYLLGIVVIVLYECGHVIIWFKMIKAAAQFRNTVAERFTRRLNDVIKTFLALICVTLSPTACTRRSHPRRVTRLVTSYETQS